jgi:hypothetical protein
LSTKIYTIYNFQKIACENQLFLQRIIQTDLYNTDRSDGPIFDVFPLFCRHFNASGGVVRDQEAAGSNPVAPTAKNKGKRQKNSPQFLTTFSGGYNFGKVTDTEIAAA